MWVRYLAGPLAGKCADLPLTEAQVLLDTGFAEPNHDTALPLDPVPEVMLPPVPEPDDDELEPELGDYADPGL